MINDVRINTTAPVCIRLSAMHISKVCDHVKCVTLIADDCGRFLNNKRDKS